MEVLPRFVSTDQEGMDPREFLIDSYDTREAMEAMSRDIAEELAGLTRMGKTVAAGEAAAMAQTVSKAEAAASLPHSQPDSHAAEGLSQYYRYLDTLICQKVYLDAMLDYLNHGGKSRGSAVYAEPEQPEKESEEQIVVPRLAAFSLDGPDGRAHQHEVQEIAYDGAAITCRANWRPVRRLEDIPESGPFEVVWKEYRSLFAKHNA